MVLFFEDGNVKKEKMYSLYDNVNSFAQISWQPSR